MTMTTQTDRAAAPDNTEISKLKELGQQLRVDGIRMSTRAGSGHPTSSMSAADLIAVLGARHLRYDWKKPDNPANDHLIFSKGHASPLLYAFYRAAGAIDQDEMMKYRTFGCRLEGHPTPAIPWVDVATGSLGQGLPIAVGVALAGKRLDRLPYRVWVLCGDSELAEGSIWEALDKAGHYQLDNLIVLFDVNRLGQRGETEFGWDTGIYKERVEAFGCRAIVIDGHDVASIDRAMTEAASTKDRPTVIIAKTVKGKGFAEIEDKDGWHGKPLPPEMAERAIKELGGVRNLQMEVHLPAVEPPAAGAARPAGRAEEPAVQLPEYKRGEKVATRLAYGEALRAIGVRHKIVAMDGEVSNSTYADLFKQAYPDRFFEMFIAEQQLVATAVGMSVRGYIPFASTFAAFFSRAYDFIRMASISEANIRLVGSHAGVEIGADGPSQMALEDLAAMRAVRGSTVLYPSDATSTGKLVEEMAKQEGIVYMRTTRGAYPVIYPASEAFPIGGSKLLAHHADDRVTIIAAGVTVHLALDAVSVLEKEGINCRLIDLYSVKPVDLAALKEARKATEGRFVIVEDHYPQGGLAASVLEALAPLGETIQLRHLAVDGLPGSGSSEELLDAAGISSRHIVSAARELALR